VPGKVLDLNQESQEYLGIFAWYEYNNLLKTRIPGIFGFLFTI